MADNGGPKRGLRGREGELVALLADGLTCGEAAKWMGVGLRTVERYAARPDTKRAVKELRDRRAADLIGGLGAAGGEAVATLRSLMANAPPGVKLGAARSVLEFLLKGRELVELAARVADLEQADAADAGDSAGEAGGGPEGGPAGGGHPVEDQGGPGGGADAGGDDPGPVAAGLGPLAG